MVQLPALFAKMNPQQHTGLNLWHSPFTFLPTPTAGMIVSGVALPARQQVTAYNSISDAYSAIPYQQRRIGDIVAVHADINGDTYIQDRYIFYYWHASIAGDGSLQWTLRRVNSGIDYRIVKQVLAAGIEIPLPANNTLHRIALKNSQSCIVTITNGVDTIIEEELAPNTLQWVNIDYCNNSGATQTLYITRDNIGSSISPNMSMYFYNNPFDANDY